MIIRFIHSLDFIDAEPTGNHADHGATPHEAVEPSTAFTSSIQSCEN